MKIQNIKIKNLKCFSDFNFSPLNQDFNLLVGENGVGKTSIFESIRILLDYNFSLKDYFTDEDFLNKNEPIFIEIDISFDINYSNLIDFSDYIYDIDDKNVYVKLGFAIKKYENYDKNLNNDEKEKLDSFNEGFYYSRISVDEIQQEDKLEILYENYKVSYKNFKKNFKIIYIDGSRSYKYFYDSNSEFSNLLKNEKEKLEEIEVLNTTFKDEILNSEGFKDFFSGNNGNINNELEKISLKNDSKIESSLSIEVPDQKLPFRILKNLLKINLNGNIPLEKNSIGWQYIYYTVFNLFYLKNSENSFNIFLMEEPEAHLHPQMQRKLFNYINQREKSIIYVSTHSQTIVRTIRNIEKTNLIKLNSNFSLPKKDDFKNLNLTKLNTFVDINKAELFFSRGIIFVEGISEEILLPKLFGKKFGDKLEDYGISIININGTDFQEYVKLAEIYEIPFIILTDKDLIWDKEENIIKEDCERRINNLDNDTLFLADIDTFEIDLLHGNNSKDNKEIFEKIFKDNFKDKKLNNCKENIEKILASSKKDEEYEKIKKIFFG